MYNVIGSCSLCGGPVQVPTVYQSVNPPTPTCGRCGAVKRDDHGPVVDMVQPRVRPPTRPFNSGGISWYDDKG